MLWWSKNKKIILLIFTGLLVLAGVIVGLLVIIGPTVGCTFVGCRSGIDVELSNLPVTAPYQVVLSFSSGETSAISCVPDTEDNPNSFEKSCSATGAYFSLEPDVLPPDEITVTVIVGESQTSQVFHPDYKKFQPNGRSCKPTCYSAMVKMDLPR